MADASPALRRFRIILWTLVIVAATLVNVPSTPVALSCHCAAGAGAPVALAISGNASPGTPVSFGGCCVICGPVLDVLMTVVVASLRAAKLVVAA